MANAPSVCIVIPTYNQDNFITTAVNSALRQTYLNLKVIVADDCSTDNTELVLKNFLSIENFRYYKMPKNIGRVKNYRNALYNLIDTDWVINLDGDDYYTNNDYVKNAMDEILKIGESEVLFYQGGHVYKTPVLEKIYSALNIQKQHITSCEDYFLKFYRFKHFSHMSTLYNRNLALQSKMYEADATSSDVISFLNLCLDNREKKIILSLQVSGVWLQHNNNASGAINYRQVKNNLKGYRQLYKKAVFLGLPQKKLLHWWCNFQYSSLIQKIKALLIRSS